MTFEEMSERLFNKWESNIPYRTISPRIFEAATFHVCQILYEGEYQGTVQPMVDYLPLKKDFSNFDEILKLYHDTEFRKQITDNCYQHLIASGKYTCEKFINGFDEELVKQGFDYRLSHNQRQNMGVWFDLNKDIPLRIVPRYVMYISNEILSILEKLISTTEFGKKNIMPTWNRIYRFIYMKLTGRFYDYGL